MTIEEEMMIEANGMTSIKDEADAVRERISKEFFRDFMNFVTGEMDDFEDKYDA